LFSPDFNLDIRALYSSPRGGFFFPRLP
jgi:hypothetical protein